MPSQADEFIDDFLAHYAPGYDPVAAKAYYERTKKLKSYVFPKGTTAVLNEKVIKKEDLSKFVTVHEVQVGEEGEKMVVD